MKKEVKEKLNSLKITDVYSLMLFALHKLKDIPEYSVISELAYILDGKSLFNLMEYFGGMKLAIPSIEDFKTVTYALLLYQYVNIEHIELKQALRLIDADDISTKEVKECYAKLVDILNDYEFSRS